MAFNWKNSGRPLAEMLTGAPDEADDRFVNVNGQRLRYVKRPGGSETVLFIHGFGSDINNWALNLDEFSDIASTYALDLPGHGRSEVKLTTTPVASLLATLQNFITALELPPLHLVGHSLGGLLAALVALKQPDAIKTLTLISSAGLGQQIDAAFIRKVVAADDREQLKPVLERLFQDPRLVSDEMITEVALQRQQPMVKSHLAALERALIKNGRQQIVLPKRLQKLAIPILAIAGRHDRIIPPRQLQNLGPKTVRLVVPHAAHVPQMEQYRTVNAAIREHIARSQQADKR